jgi:hypothetical protein
MINVFKRVLGFFVHITRWEMNQRSIRDSGFQPLHKPLILKIVSAMFVETLGNSQHFTLRILERRSHALNSAA